MDDRLFARGEMESAERARSAADVRRREGENGASQSPDPIGVRFERPALPFSLFLVEALTASGTSLLVAAIYFYTAHQFGWGLKQNFLLATGQGAVYVVGALSAGALSRRIGKIRLLAIVYVCMAVLPLIALVVHSAPPLTILLLAYSFMSAIGWPILESMVSSGVGPGEMSRRQSIYNIVWSILGVAMLAVDGTLIVRWPTGLFLIPVCVHASSAVVLWITRASHTVAPARQKHEAAMREPSDDAHWAGLLQRRTLALWLSRVALPATYVVIFSLMALMPSLPVVRQLGEARQTILSSVWMASRTVIFVLLGLTTWWHARPRLLLVAAVIMLVAFFGVTVRPSDLLGRGLGALDIGSMIAWQLVLGAALGLIYSASLYFGMVLSEGSTEHGGYHEALIGMGYVLGPGAGAVAEVIRPGSIYAGIIAIGAIVGLSVIAVAITSIVGARRQREREST